VLDSASAIDLVVEQPKVEILPGIYLTRDRDNENIITIEDSDEVSSKVYLEDSNPALARLIDVSNLSARRSASIDGCFAKSLSTQVTRSSWAHRASKNSFARSALVMEDFP
jgi:hypothetical protein